ncbi:hypothetical protein BJ165DRAFT_761540 [Panaeolus papilionaceus]|nr:hypothetical protein BJ165DRAFT_761540 [Panaeolus papilionaceus]
MGWYWYVLCCAVTVLNTLCSCHVITFTHALSTSSCFLSLLLLSFPLLLIVHFFCLFNTFTAPPTYLYSFAFPPF